MSQENNFIPSQDGYKPLTPFKLFVKSNFPFIEATYEALDNYGLYCKIVEYLNNVIENENTVESNVQALYDAFVSLNNYVSDYFDNLDVQEEINNKLDELVTSGELEEIFLNIFNGLQEQITANKNRIDEISSLPSGSTTGDAELIDGRVGFNGSTYSNIGNAIRGQAENNYDIIKDHISNYSTVINNSTIEWESGSIAVNGYKQSNVNIIRTKDFIKVSKGSVIKLSNYDPYVYRVCMYQNPEHTDGNTIYGSDFINKPFVIYQDCYIKVAISKYAEITDISSVSQYFNGFLYIKNKYTRTTETTELNNKLVFTDKKVNGVASQFLEIENQIVSDWVAGSIIFDNGYTGTGANSCRTSSFTKVLKGSVISLSDYSKTRMRVLVYPNEAYQTPLETSGWKQEAYEIKNDGYMAICLNDTNVTPITDETKNEYISLLNVFIISDKNLSTYILPESWTNTVSTLKKYQGLKNCIGVQTDTHYSIEKNDNENTARNLKEFTKIMGMDFICNLGDIIQGYETNNITDMQKSFTEIMKRYTDNVECPFLYTLGNHEDCYLIAQYGTQSLDETILFDELYSNTIPFIKNSNYGKLENNKKLYYYKDFDDYRVIVLDTRDIPFQQLGPSDIHINHHVISQTQVTWFVNDALNTTKPVLVLSHVPLVSDLLLDTNSVENANLIVSALETYSATHDVIGCLCGHIHKQDSAKINGINYISFANGGLFSELCFIDTTNKTLTTKLVGDYPNTLIERSFTY